MKTFLNLKLTITILILILASNWVVAQSNKLIFDSLGIFISYSYNYEGIVKNPKTGLNFKKYKLTSVIKNNSNKSFKVFESNIAYDYLRVQTNFWYTEDLDFFKDNNNGIKANHFMCGGSCSTNKTPISANELIICSNQVSVCEVFFLHPIENKDAIPFVYDIVKIEKLTNE